MSAFLVLRWLSLLVDASVKSLLLLVPAGVSHVLLRRASAASRHLVWRLAIGGLLGLPLLSAVLPTWKVRAWPHYLPALSAIPSQAPALSIHPTAAPPAPPLPPFQLAWISAGMARRAAGLTSGPPAQAVGPTNRWHLSQPMLTPITLFWIWLAGTLATLAPVLAGLARVRWIGRRSRRVTEGPLPSMAGELCRALSMPYPVTVLVGRPAVEPLAPMTWGWRRPVVLLPAGSESWPESRLRAVLLHELAHVRRRDWPAQMLAHLTAALYWFQPLIWLAVRQLRFESERACDDQVLATGVRATDYAGHLLAIVRSLRGLERTLPAALALVPRPPIERRLRSILDSRHDRRDLPRWMTLPAALLCLAALIPLAAVRPTDHRLSSRPTGKRIRVALAGRCFQNRRLAEAEPAIRVAILERSERPSTSPPASRPTTRAPRNVAHERPGVPRRAAPAHLPLPITPPARRLSHRFIATLPGPKPPAADRPAHAPATPNAATGAVSSTAQPAAAMVTTEVASLPDADADDTYFAPPTLMLASEQPSDSPGVSEAVSSPAEPAEVTLAVRTETASSKASSSDAPVQEPDTDVLPATGQDRDALFAPPEEEQKAGATHHAAFLIVDRDGGAAPALLSMEQGKIRAAELVVWNPDLQQWERYLLIWDSLPAVLTPDQPDAEAQEPPMSAPAGLSGPGSLDEDLWYWDQVLEDDDQEPADERQPPELSVSGPQAAPSPV